MLYKYAYYIYYSDGMATIPFYLKEDSDGMVTSSLFSEKNSDGMTTFPFPFK